MFPHQPPGRWEYHAGIQTALQLKKPPTKCPCADPRAHARAMSYLMLAIEQFRRSSPYGTHSIEQSSVTS